MIARSNPKLAEYVRVCNLHVFANNNQLAFHVLELMFSIVFLIFRIIKSSFVATLFIVTQAAAEAPAQSILELTMLLVELLAAAAESSASESAGVFPMAAAERLAALESSLESLGDGYTNV